MSTTNELRSSLMSQGTEEQPRICFSATTQIVLKSALLSGCAVAGFLLILIYAKSVTSSVIFTGIVYGWTFCMAAVLAFWHCMTKRHSERIFKSVFGFVACVPLLCILVSCHVRGHCLHALFGESGSTASTDSVSDATLILSLLLSFAGGYLASFIYVGFQTCCPGFSTCGSRHRMISMNEAMQTLSTGDIMLTSDRKLPSKIIKMFTLSRSSHAIMIIRDVPQYVLNLYGCPARTDEACALEATPGGVRLEPLREWFADAECSNFYDLVVTRRLYCAKPPISDRLRHDALIELMVSACGKSFEESPCRLLQSILGMNEDSDEQYFCSELVASAYRELGVFSVDSVAANVTPDAFLSGDLDFLPWAPDQAFHLGPKVVVDIFRTLDESVRE
eukprot:TRINITY_DN2939_c0_g1_i1.p1 TRINITY_DN2939_c0_g1~~TRINITY_DN2939_c0_g1_i1.p1  ORF type:complete len:391 (+),score=34.61 TRINITY_DN2939_c0_g1_i1:274-1446(+)